MVNGAGGHAVYAHSGQRSPQEQPTLRSRASHLLPKSNSYRCPAGQQPNFVGLNVRNRTHAYIGSRKRCWASSQKAQCTAGQYKYLAIHIHEPVRQRARDLANTPSFANAQRERTKVEALFAELKNQIGLRRLRLRRLKFVQEQFFIAAAAQSIKRLVPFPQPRAAATAPSNDLVVYRRKLSLVALLTQHQPHFQATLFQQPHAIPLTIRPISVLAILRLH